MWRQSISSNRGKAIYYPKWYKQYIQHFGLCRDLLQIIGYEIADHTKSTFFLPLSLSIAAISFYMFAVGIARFINWKYITNLLVNIFLNYNMLEKVLNIETLLYIHIRFDFWVYNTKRYQGKNLVNDRRSNLT